MLPRKSEESSLFLDQLATDMSSLNETKDPIGKSTRNGFQTDDNLFDLKLSSLNKAGELIRRLIMQYKAAHLTKPCGLISNWPEKFTINCWCVRLPKGGFQEAHIHPAGWLSGVLYIKVPQEITGDEAAIEFNLQGLYPLKNENVPKFILRPQNGDIVIFPSSLFHKTIPFDSSEERICISFDLVPVRSESKYGDYPSGTETGIIISPRSR